MAVIVAVISSISELIRRVRDEHMVSIASITLIKDMMNVPPSDPPDSADVQNFDCTEGRAILDAVRQYNSDLPLGQYVSVVPTATSFYLDSIIDDWVPGFRVVDIYHPRDYENPIPRINWRQGTDSSNGRPTLSFVDFIPTETFAMAYFRDHLFDIGKDLMSIPAEHIEAVACLAAGKILRKASRKASSFGDKPGGYENKDLTGPRQRWADDAKDCEQTYKDLIEAEKPAFPKNWIEWPFDESITGSLVFHGRSTLIPFYPYGR